jgi:hypothetical protein
MRARRHRAARFVSALVLVTMLLVLALPVGATSQRAYSYDGPLENVVAEWNRHTFEALSNAATGEIMGAGQPPPVSSLYVAMVHGAIYDAVIMIDGGYQPYLGGLPIAPRTASKAAAVATAAHDVLVGVVLTTPLNPAIITRLGTARDATLAAATAADGPASVTAGVAAGKVAAAAMLAERANDGRYGAYRFASSEEPGKFRFKPTDPPTANRFDWVAKVEPFLVESPDQFRSQGPNALTSEAYAKDYNEVRILGAKTGSGRTPAQEALAQFYNVNAAELYFRSFRTIAVEQKLTLVQQARLFAMLGMANADALITCWADKGHWSFWRPDTAIAQADADGNPATAPDPSWAPLLPEPPYPEHSSGFNCIAGAIAHIAKAFFGRDEVTFSMVSNSPGASGATRTFARFTDLTRDSIDVRVYHGVHFRTADVQGARLGQNVAEWLAARHFRPVPAPPSTGTGGTLPGLPSTGAGGAQAVSLGWIALLASGGVAAGGWYLRRRRRQA